MNTITQETELPKSLADRVQELRVRLFVPLNLAHVCARSVDFDRDIHLQMTLEHMYELIDQIALDMDELSGEVGRLEGETRGTPQEEA